VLKTTNGGATWTLLNPLEPGVIFTTVSFASAMRGWIGGDGLVQTTSDGGATWTRQTVADGSVQPLPVILSDSLALSLTKAVLVGTFGPAGRALRTVDGGATWTLIEVNGDAGLRGVALGDATHLWAVGQFGQIFASSDGATWGPQPSPASDDLNGVWFVNATTGWAVGNGGTILKTTSGGRTGS
jgi:photosystem II stability/assembly factor-like uncharacterized protein